MSDDTPFSETAFEGLLRLRDALLRSGSQDEPVLQMIHHITEIERIVEELRADGTIVRRS